MAKKKLNLNYLGSLQLELDAIVNTGEFVDSGDPLGKNDTILGELSPEVKAIRTLMFRKKDEAKLLVEKFLKDGFKLELEELGELESVHQKLEKIGKEIDFLSTLTWRILEEIYPDKNLKLVEGFRVVKPGKSEEQEAFEETVNKITESLGDSAKGVAKLIAFLIED
ncbi:MAG: hypothetical protein LBD11_03665 [Candidatus Peribacteria bacterium]|jgi:uroporphyrinogen-III synthase|nr:hypothetical protein [Candidatus Peribacteria bacterium]